MGNTKRRMFEMIKVPFESARTVHGGLSSIITVSTRWMYPFVHSMFGRTILPWTEINGVGWFYQVAGVHVTPPQKLFQAKTNISARLYKCRRPWSWQQAPRTHTTLCKRQTQSLRLPWRSNLLPKKKCVTFLHQVLQLWSSVCLYTCRLSKKKQVTEYVQMTFTSVLTVLRGLRKLFSASCSIVNARLEMITCLSIICFGCKSLLLLILSSFFLLLRRSHVWAISALIVNEQMVFCVFCRKIFAGRLT